MKNATYVIEFFHRSEGVWQNAGLHPFSTHQEAEDTMRSEEEMTNNIIDFRVIEVSL